MSRFILIGVGNMGKEIGKILSKSPSCKEIIGVDPQIMNHKNTPFPIVDSISRIKISPTDCSILCIKPQDLPSFSRELYISEKHMYLNEKSSLISILAGVKISTLTSFLPQRRISRAIPNLALKHGKSDTVYFTEDEELANITHEIFSQAGNPIRVNGDNEVDVSTAIVGSGPAFLLKMAQSMSEEAQAQGISKTISDKFAIGALKGVNSVDNIPETIQKITSKGGTTEIGLSTLDKNNFDHIIKSTIQDTISRGNELDFKVKYRLN